MILCSCNRITSRDLENAVDRLMREDPSCPVTVGQVYRSLGKRPKCGGCLANTNKHVRLRVACRQDECECACPCACEHNSKHQDHAEFPAAFLEA